MFSFQRLFDQLKIVLFHGTRTNGTTLLVFSLMFLGSHYNLFNHLSLIERDPFIWFEFLTVLASMLTSIQVFRRLRSEQTGISYLMVPATSFEKFLAAFLYTTVGTFLIYLISFSLIHGLVIGINNLGAFVPVPYSFTSLFRFWAIFKTLLFVQSLYFLGSLLFKKNPLAMTSLVIFSCIVLVSMTMGWLFVSKAGMDIQLLDSEQTVNFQASGVLDEYKRFFIIGSWILPFVCWILAYFRLKSTQI